MIAIRKLRRELRRRKWSQADLARAAGLSETLVSYYLCGKRRPGIASAARIERATEGAVPIVAWLDGPGVELHPTGCNCARCRRGMD